MPYLSQPVVALALGVIAGGFLQLALQIPFLRHKGIVLRINCNFSHPGLRRLLKLMVPAVFGAAVYQLNMLIITLLASFLPAGSVSYLYYADRLFQFPLALFGIALATVSLPTMADHVANNNIEDLKETLSYSLRIVLFITIPAMVGLVVLATPLVQLLFQRGVFTAPASQLTAQALFHFSVGLWAVAGVRVVANVFYALQDIWTPVKVAFISIAANLLLSLVLMKPLQHAGLALAVSLSSMINLALLLAILRIRLGRLKIKRLVSSVGKIIISSAVMGIGVYLTFYNSYWASSSFPFSRVVAITTSILVGVGVFAFSSYLLKSPELSSLWGGVKEGRRSP